MKSSKSFACRRSFFSKNSWLFLPFLFLLPAMISCAEGGGIGGTGAMPAGDSGTGITSVTSVGPITARGSISVNGIEFETTGAAVVLAGVSSDEKELQVGMVVKVEGTANADGKTGKANVVVFAPIVAGLINSIDFGKSTLEVMGQTVLVDAQTVITGLPGTPGLADLAANDPVEISGLADADGNVKATRITRKTASGQPEVNGRVSSLTSVTFNINALAVDYGNAILGNFGLSGIQPGDIVQVKGNFTAPATLRADVIEKKSPAFQDGNIAIEGFINSLFFAGQSVSGFTIITQFGLQRIELNVSTEFSGGQLPIAGARVKAEGTIQDNIIRAEKVTFF